MQPHELNDIQILIDGASSSSVSTDRDILKDLLEEREDLLNEVDEMEDLRSQISSLENEVASFQVQVGDLEYKNEMLLSKFRKLQDR